MLEKLVEDKSLESAITELISRTGLNTGDSSLPNRDFGLFLAIVNAQRSTLQDERERLRYENTPLLLTENCFILSIVKIPDAGGLPVARTGTSPTSRIAPFIAEK